MNLSVLKQLDAEAVAVELRLVRLDAAEPQRESELDEMWSFVGNKAISLRGCGTQLSAGVVKF